MQLIQDIVFPGKRDGAPGGPRFMSEVKITQSDDILVSASLRHAISSCHGRGMGQSGEGRGYVLSYNDITSWRNLQSRLMKNRVRIK
jgi:hypothetical protein